VFLSGILLVRSLSSEYKPYNQRSPETTWTSFILNAKHLVITLHNLIFQSFYDIIKYSTLKKLAVRLLYIVATSQVFE
jgi:hypothetical protein